MKNEEKMWKKYKKILWGTIVTIIKCIPQFCINAWIKNNPELMGKSEYMELTPNKMASNTKEYFKALDLAISNPNVKNIALTGPYGSGKSSVIYSYLEQRPTIKSIIISLATFSEINIKKRNADNGMQSKKIEETRKQLLDTKKNVEFKEQQVDTENNEEQNVEFTMDELEKGILKQLFYKVNYRKIPQSRYRKIHKHGRVRTVILVFLFVIIGTFASWLFGYDFVIELYKQSGDKIRTLVSNTLISNVIVNLFIAVILCFLSHILWMSSTRIRFGGLKISDKLELATHSNERENVFNRNLDEIIYFFESTNYDVIFIEDLDRFRNNEIFIKLRELNMLINNYEMIKRKVVFVYAVRDDMFESTDRTKFFDFIIPIVPYINSTNSGEILRAFLGLDTSNQKRIIPKHKVSDKLITLVSPYISDMRVLTCIMNEFWIYIGTIKGGQKLSTLEDEKMFALIVFKNMYPKEFALLEEEKGIIKQAFQDKKEFVKNKKKPLDELVEQNVELLNKIEKDILRDVSELKISFLSYLVNFTGLATVIVADGVSRTVSEIMKDNFDFNTLNVKSMRIANKTSNAIDNQNSPNVFNEDIVVQRYFDRYNALVNGAEERREEIKKIVEETREKAEKILDESLSALLSQYAKEEILSTQVTQNNLLVFLLRHGYINENYQSYINYFHPKSISTEEMNFILGVRNHQAVGDYTYPLNHCDKVIERLEAFEFEQTEILNYSLFDYLLLHSSDYSEKYKRIIKLLTNRSVQSKGFIKSYIDREKNICGFIEALCQASSYIWFDFETDSEITNEKKEKYLLLILNVCEVKNINKNEYVIKENNKKSIKTWIEDDRDFLLKCANIPLSKKRDIISTLDVVFKDININNIDKRLLEFIYDSRHYRLNQQMLENLFILKAPERRNELSVSNYSAIRSMGYQPLLNYVYEDFVTYIQKFVLEQEQNTMECFDAINDALERLADKPEICIQLIEKQKNAFWESISDCLSNTNKKETVWNYIISTGRVGKTWCNCAQYYNLFGSSNEWLHFIESNINELVNSKKINGLTDEMINEIIGANVSLSTFEVIIQNYRVNSFTNELSSLDNDKIRLLIKEKYIPFTIERYIELSKIDSNIAADFASNNREKFIEQMGGCTLESIDIYELIKQNNFSNEEKTIFLEKLKLEEIDKDIAIKFGELSFVLPRRIVDAVWNVLEDEMKYEFLFNQLIGFSLDEIAEKFKELGGVYNQLGTRNKRKFTLPLTKYNKKMCAKLLEIGYITSYNIEEKDGEFDPVRLQLVKHNMIVGYVKQK